MALSTKARARLTSAMTRKTEAKEVADAIDANTAEVAALSGAGVGGTLTNTHIIVGNVSNLATDVAMSGDATIANTGAVTLGTTAVTGKALTGFVSGAGTVSAADTILTAFNKINGNVALLKNGTPTYTAQTVVTGAGALDTTSGESTFTNSGSTYAVTLAAPSSQDGQQKVLKAGATMTGTVTLAMTNITTYPGGASTTLTFTNAGDCAVLLAVGSKWIFLGGSAVAS